MAFAEPLTDEEIEQRLESSGWTRDGDQITRTFRHTYHECIPRPRRSGPAGRSSGHPVQRRRVDSVSG